MADFVFFYGTLMAGFDRRRRAGIDDKLVYAGRGSIQASLAEVNGQGRPLRERVLIELARAEAVRAAWLAEAVDVLQREPLPALDQVNLAAVVAAVAEALAPEHRL